MTALSTRQQAYLAAAATRRARTQALVYCPHGHAYQPDNLYVSPKGLRRCRTCIRAARQRLKNATLKRRTPQT